MRQNTTVVAKEVFRISFESSKYAVPRIVAFIGKSLTLHVSRCVPSHLSSAGPSAKYRNMALKGSWMLSHIHPARSKYGTVWPLEVNDRRGAIQCSRGQTQWPTSGDAFTSEDFSFALALTHAVFSLP